MVRHRPRATVNLSVVPGGKAGGSLHATGGVCEELACVVVRIKLPALEAEVSNDRDATACSTGTPPASMDTMSLSPLHAATVASSSRVLP